MGFVNQKGEKLNENDVKALEEMLKGSLESHLARLVKYEEDTDEPNFYPPIKAVYEKTIQNLPEMIQNENRKGGEIRVSDFISSLFGEISEQMLEVVDKESPCFYEFWEYVAKGFGEKKLMDGLADEPEAYSVKDTGEGYQKTAGAFQFATEPMKGIEDIKEYDPNTDSVKDLYKGRAGNSATLGADIEKLQQELEQLKQVPDDEQHLMERNRRNNIQKKIDDAFKGEFGLNAGAEIARIHSAELKGKEQVTFGDLYRAVTEINQVARPGDPAGGKLRGIQVQAGQVEGVAASVAPEAFYKTLGTIADGMNQIKNTEDPALRKTRAVQLASFAYQMTLSEHVFGDGNGRTCRLFADTILQTFGLPPHTPTKEEQTLCKTIGNEMDFQKGAEVFLKGVQLSDQELKRDPEERKQSRISEPPRKEAGREETSMKLSALYEVNDATVAYFEDLQKRAKKAKGTFRDSKEYKDLCAAIDKCLKLSRSMMDNEDELGTNNFNVDKAEAEYASAVRKLFKTAKAYESYKMKDHTEDKSAEPDKKKLNSDDRKKLNLVSEVTNNEDIIKVKNAAPKGGRSL